MSDYHFLHEVEVVSFVASAPRRVSTIGKFLRQLGFSLHDDVFSFDRKGRIPPWQHSSIVEVKFIRQGIELFDVDGEWDQLDFEYLYASLPEQYVQIYLDLVRKISIFLDLEPVHNGEIVSFDSLELIFRECAQDLEREYGETAGSESLAIMVQMTYPR
jgi:hypothetical protein